MTDHAIYSAEILEASSLFLYVASERDIDDERQRMEADYDCGLAVFEICYPIRGGIRCTQITWEVV